MPLDQFKTQVLLLHSEQSTLDTLSSGFSDRYTVHRATSGSEALTTLGETPINVIISAQDLPGMSGVEALREAKKRSPDTIGILLAGQNESDVQALVGDEEVFQVVSGTVTGDGLRRLVDNATQQVRLMALAESANDTAANPDDLSAEHIVMETSENGSTIISDGTGRMPALNPKKISAAAAVGAQSVGVLVLTKDEEFLTTIKESSRGMHTVHLANTLKQADDAIRKHKIGVAVVDAAMVGEKVEQLTQHLRKAAPRLVPIVAGRRDDGEMLMDLINRGKVYRFLLKPVSPGRARLAVEASVKHHLEAPDAAFKTKGGPAPVKPAPKPAAKPAPAKKAAPPPKPPAKPVATTRAKPTPKPSPAQPKKAAAPAPSAPVDPPLGDPTIKSPVDEGLASAFGSDDTSFTETVTNLVSGVSKKFKGKEKKTETAPTPHALHDLESPATSGGIGGMLPGGPKVIGIAVAAVAVVAAGLFWLLSGDEAPVPVEEPVVTSTPSITESDVVIDDVIDEPAADVAGFVDEARLARDAGQVFNPPGSNAIELYLAAVAADPENVIVAAELDATVEQALGMAEAALLESRAEDADAALQRVALADPENSRLVFLTAQLEQMQLRTHLADARAAIRDTRFEDAGNSLAAARALGTSDAAEIDAVAEELSSARSEQQVGEVLALATARLEEGSLLSPPNDNARYYYDLVLSNDSDNAAARQGLSVVANKLVLQARTEIDNGNLNTAEDLLADVRAIDASNSELDATAAALITAREAIAERARLAEQARLQAEADRRAEQERAEAERRAAEIRAEEEQRIAAEAQAELDAQQAAAAEAQAELDAQQQAAAVEATPAEETAAATAGAVAADESAADVTPVQEPPAEVQEEVPVRVTSLNRTRYVAPKYPRSAERRSLSGWVDVIFTVTLDGTVRDVQVRKSDPEKVFDSAAIRAVEKWEFEPVVENGVAVEKLAGVRMMFAIE